MAKGYKKNYRGDNQNYGNWNDSQGQDKMFVGDGKTRRSVRWVSCVLTLLFTVALLAGTYFLTGGFYSKNVQAWDMQAGWYSSIYEEIYTSNNGLISRENHSVKSGGKSLIVYADFEEAEDIAVSERAYLRYNVVYYKGDEVVGQSEGYYIPYDTYADEDSLDVIWSYAEALKDPEFKALEVDSVKVAIFHEDTAKTITVFNRATYVNVITLMYE